MLLLYQLFGTLSDTSAAEQGFEALLLLLLLLQDTSRQHFEKMCQVTSQVDSLLTQRSGACFARN